MKIEVVKDELYPCYMFRKCESTERGRVQEVSPEWIKKAIEIEEAYFKLQEELEEIYREGG